MSSTETQPAREASRLTLDIGPDRMQVRATGAGAFGSLDELIDGVRELMEEKDLQWPAEDTELRERLSHVLETEETWKVVVLEGTPTVPAVDESVEWTRDFLGEDYQVDPVTGRIDYRERAASRNVVAGETLGRVVGGEPGTPGIDIFGKEVAPRVPKKTPVRTGKNVRLDEATRSFEAEADGRFRLSSNVVHVDQVMEVAGNVGLESGNVEFPGAVIVGGDVEDVAYIKAGGAVTVGNVVGAAEIHSGGAVVVSRGIAGKGKGVVAAEGEVQTGYINNAVVRSDSSVTVISEIVQSDVRVLGPVTVKEGRIVGGQVIALQEVTAAQLGSDASVPTLIAAGEDHTFPDFVAENEGEMAGLRRQCQLIREKIDPLQSRMKQLSHKQREACTELMFSVQEREAQLAAIEKEIDNHRRVAEEHAVKRIQVIRKIFPRVTLRIAGVSLEIHEPVTGPVTAVLDESEGVIALKKG